MAKLIFSNEDDVKHEYRATKKIHDCYRVALYLSNDAALKVANPHGW